MTTSRKPRDVRMIPINRITVLNTRDRDQHAFEEISANIKAIGLKKPVTVTPRPDSDGAERYLLLCGEGRLLTFKKYGEERIPALVVDVDDEQAYLISLTENIARRKYKPIERISGIIQLRGSGYSAKEIAEKVGLSVAYVSSLFTLFDRGEERLLKAVLSGSIPISAALIISDTGEDDKAVQTALQEAYESGELRGRQLMESRQLIQRRRLLGRSSAKGTPRKATNVTSQGLVRAYQKEVLRQQLLVRKASFAQQRLAFVAGALRNLLADESFANLLRAEGLDTLPQYLADRIAQVGGQL